MTTLSKAPLVEVVTQIRWGVAESNESGEFSHYVFSKTEETALPDVFARVLAEAGFGVVEDFAPGYADVQFSASRRYRRDPGQWPAYQSGLGVFTINQSNDDYDWEKYKADVLRGFELLLEALKEFYVTPPPFIGAELLYLDVFPVEGDQNPYEFLRKKFKVRSAPPKEFLSAPFLKKPEPLSASLSFDLRITEPLGMLTLSLEHVRTRVRSEYLMETSVLSFPDGLTFSREGLGQWLEAAHEVQRHAFGTLINPAYMRSFQ